MQLFAHPFSSYCQKVLIALYENGTPFQFRLLAPDQPAVVEEHAAHWPLRRFPVLVDDGRTLMEASIIVEYLDLRHPGPVRLVPEDARQALDVRLLDRIFDNYVMTPMQKIVGDSRSPVLRRYRQRLLERPSFARAVDEARPYRSLFPLGAPDRD